MVVPSCSVPDDPMDMLARWIKDVVVVTAVGMVDRPSLLHRLQAMHGYIGADLPDRIGPAYEAHITSGAKQTKSSSLRGVHYTAPAVARIVVDDVVTPLLDSARKGNVVRILDPACGAGACLLAAYRACVSVQLAGKMDDLDARLHLLCTQIHGLDIDPCAVVLCQLALLLEALGTAPWDGVHLPSIHCGNALVSLDYPHTEDVQGVRPFAIEEGFPVVHAAGGFDAIVGNPPFMNVRHLHLRTPREVAYLRERYTYARQSWDICSLFFERALQWTKPGGRIGFVGPIQLLHQPNGEAVRQGLVEGTEILSVVDLAPLQLFDHAAVAGCVLTARKLGNPTQNPAPPLIRVMAPSSIEQLAEGASWRWPRSEVRTHRGYSLRPNLLSPLHGVFAAMEAVADPLSAIAYVTSGLRSCAKGRGLGGKDRLITNDPNAPNARRYLEGRDIEAFALRPRRPRYLRYEPTEMYSARTPALFEADKIVSRSMLGSMRPVAAVDRCGYFVENNLLCIVPHGVVTPPTTRQVPLEFLAAVINARIQGFYFGACIVDRSLGGGMIHATPGSQQRLLVPYANPQQIDTIVGLVTELARLRDAPARLRLRAAIDACIDPLFHLDVLDRRRVEGWYDRGG